MCCTCIFSCYSSSVTWCPCIYFILSENAWLFKTFEFQWFKKRRKKKLLKYKQVMRFLSEMNVWQNGERKEFYPALAFWFDCINIQGFVGIPLKFHTKFWILNLHTYIWSIYVDLLVFWSADYRVLNTDSPLDQPELSGLYTSL